MEPNTPSSLPPTPTMTITPKPAMASGTVDMHRAKRMYFIYGVGITALVAAVMMLVMYLVLQANGANVTTDPYYNPTNGYSTPTSSSSSSEDTSSSETSSSSSSASTTSSTSSVSSTSSTSSTVTPSTSSSTTSSSTSSAATT